MATLLIIGAAPAAMQAQLTRTPNPNAPRLLVGDLRSSDKKLSRVASDEVRQRLAHDIPGRLLTVISSFDYKTVVEVGGDEELTRGDLGSVAKLLRTDEFIDGTVARTASGFLINATLILTRDETLTQPLPPAEGDQLATVASVLSKHVRDALKQMEFEKRCTAFGRSGKVSEAITAARQGVAVYPRATLARLCELQVRVGAKQAPDSILAIAREIITIDPQSQRARTYAAQAYREKGDQHGANEMLLQLFASNPTDRRIVVDVVNALVSARQWDTATPIIAQAIKDNPGDVLLLKLGFQIYMASGDRQRGYATGKEMVKIDTSLADSAYRMTLIAAHRADSAYAKAAADSIVVLASVQQSTIRQALREVIRDSAAFARVWGQLRTHRASPPKVDFSRDEVIVIALGHQPGSGNGARVLRVQSTAGRDSIFVELQRPGEHCGTLPMETAPVVVIRHHRTARSGPSQSAVFVETVRAFPCR